MQQITLAVSLADTLPQFHRICLDN